MTSPFTVKVTNPKFRITIPVDVRAAEDIEIGDILEIIVTKKEKKK